MLQPVIDKLLEDLLTPLLPAFNTPLMDIPSGEESFMLWLCLIFRLQIMLLPKTRASLLLEQSLTNSLQQV